MRRPGQTAKQKKHAREQRALLTLRRAAVKYSAVSDNEETEHDTLALCFADLITACDRYRGTLTEREQRRLVR